MISAVLRQDVKLPFWTVQFKIIGDNAEEHLNKAKTYSKKNVSFEYKMGLSVKIQTDVPQASSNYN